MNNKVLSVVLVTGIVTTWFAGISAADEWLLGENLEQKVELMEENLEQKFDSLENRFSGNKFGKRKGLKHLTDDEKQALETMSDEEKKAFFDAKKAQMKAKKQLHKTVVAKLIVWEVLSDDEELARVEILERLSGDKASKREHTATIKKLVNGETLTVAEQAELAAMQAKHAEREEMRAIIEPIKQKKKAGEELTEEEKNILKEARKNKKGHKKWKRHDRYDDDDNESDED